MTDIVERLRHQVRDLHGDDFTSPYEGFVSPLDAADEIERLRADNERLRAALTRLRDCDWVISLPDRMDAVRDIARRALEGKDD